MTNIAIIGYGELGKAIHKLLKIKNDLVVEVWDKNEKQKQKSLKDTISAAKIVLLCVPSWCVREVLENIKPFLRKQAFVVCLAKGIEEKTLKTMDEVLLDELGNKFAIAILSGPMIAEELFGAKGGFAVAAFKSKKQFNTLFSVFQGTGLKLEYSNDLRGAALCGVLKNIYALGLGMADGLGLGGNVKGKLSAMAITEMVDEVKLLGGKKNTVFGIAGIGDFIATGFSRYSRNREVGEKLVKTGICCLESEGYKSIKQIAVLLDKNIIKFPFFSILKLIIVDGHNPKQELKKLLI